MKNKIINYTKNKTKNLTKKIKIEKMASGFPKLPGYIPTYPIEVFNKTCKQKIHKKKKKGR